MMILKKNIWHVIVKKELETWIQLLRPQSVSSSFIISHVWIMQCALISKISSLSVTDGNNFYVYIKKYLDLNMTQNPQQIFLDLH